MATVTKAYTVKKVSKAGKPMTVHYVKLDDGREVNIGFKKLFEEGDTFTGGVELKYGELQHVPGGSDGPGKPAPSAAPAAFPVDLRSKDNSICRQSALKAAVDTVSNYYTSVSSATPPAKLDEYAEEVLTIAYKYADFSTGNRERKMCMASAELPD